MTMNGNYSIAVIAMKYDDYELHYKMPFQTDDEARILGDLHYEQDQISIEMGRMRFLGQHDPVEYARLEQIDAEYEAKIESLMRVCLDRQFVALIEDFTLRGITGDDWYFVDIMREWMTYMDDDPDDDARFYEGAVASFRETIDIPDADIGMIDARRFPGFMHSVLVRGDAAFHCRLLGREIQPLRIQPCQAWESAAVSN